MQESRQHVSAGSQNRQFWRHAYSFMAPARSQTSLTLRQACLDLSIFRLSVNLKIADRNARRPLQRPRQIPPRMTLRAGGNGLRRAGADERASAVAAFGAEVDDPVCRFDDVEIVFDDDDGVSVVA